jgi:hypothetical protein
MDASGGDNRTGGRFNPAIDDCIHATYNSVQD